MVAMSNLNWKLYFYSMYSNHVLNSLIKQKVLEWTICYCGGENKTKQKGEHNEDLIYLH